jgi:tetratricopeptide (TPR) repeat protein
MQKFDILSSLRSARSNMNEIMSMRSIILIVLTLSIMLIIKTERSAAAPPEEVQKGIAEARSGRLDAAIKTWTDVIKKRPKCYAAYVNRGAAYMQSGYVFRGVMDWNRARILAPMFAYSVHFSDYITEAPKNKDILNFAASLELYPDHVPSVCMMGSTLMDLGYKEKAAQLFRNSCDLTKNPLLKNHLEYWAASLESSSGEY